MMPKSLLTFLCLWLSCTAGFAHARPIVADLSVHSVDIDHNFSGMEILLFGARNDVGRIVVLLRGEPRNYLVRKKEKLGFIWMNRDHVEFQDVPSLYAVASTHPLKEIKNEHMLKTLGLGLHNLTIQAVPEHHSTRDSETLETFKQALVQEKKSMELFDSNITPITFWSETLFRSQLRFPENLERGWYTAEIYLFDDQKLVAMQSTPIHVSKIGFEAFIFQLAHQNGLLYGLLAVGMAISAGWLASRIMGRH